jgi:hypothetical protein
VSLALLRPVVLLARLSKVLLANVFVSKLRLPLLVFGPSLSLLTSLSVSSWIPTFLPLLLLPRLVVPRKLINLTMFGLALTVTWFSLPLPVKSVLSNAVTISLIGTPIEKSINMTSFVVSRLRCLFLSSFLLRSEVGLVQCVRKAFLALEKG